ncbi:MAG: hypothetical protein GEU83_12055 [Pseudonocardiaceae bacterium]|nr:hypothetical protein [Pseudonocardiaceae bacterium]
MSTHECPGGCGRAVEHHRFACRGCWFALPVTLRRAITDTYRRDRIAHARAMVDAYDWYRVRAEAGEPP